MPTPDPSEVALVAIWKRVRDHVGSRCIVDYSAYRDDENDIPIDNLDEISIVGKVRFRMPSDAFYGGGRSRDWESPVLESPTWLDLCVQANDMIRVTRDRHHCFLEGFDVTGQEDGVQIACFSMGS